MTQAQRPTPEWRKALNEALFPHDPDYIAIAAAVEELERQRDALTERVKEAERGEITWQDGNILQLKHTASIEQARAILKAYFDEWPDGLDEIESSLNQFKQRAESAESRLASLTEAAKRLAEAWKCAITPEQRAKGDAACAEIDAARGGEGK